MIPDLTALVSPVAALAPVALTAGAPALSGLREDATLPADLNDLPALAEQAVTGAAGSAVVTAVSEAGQGAVELLHLSGDLEALADEGVAAVARAAGDITVIAGQCAREVVALVVAAPLSPATGPAAAVVGQEHLARALHRLELLEQELDTLAARIVEVDSATPAAPASPGTTAVAELGGQAGQAGQAESGQDPAPVGDVGTDGGTGTSTMPGAPTPQAAAAVDAAKSALGTPYVWGGTTPGAGMDCSGLTQWSYAQAGVDIPRTADAQAVGPQVPVDQVAPGDLAVWDGHVAMIVGDGMMIEAGDPVQMSPVRTENIGMGFHGFYRPTA